MRQIFADMNRHLFGRAIWRSTPDDERWLTHTFVPPLPDGEPKLAYKDATLDGYTTVERKY
jgi:hypothetical protein